MKVVALSSSEEIAPSNGIEICFERFGAPDTPAMLMIAAAQMQEWEDEFCISLADRGFYVIRFDNRDAGKSTKLDAVGAAYVLKDMAADAVGLLDYLGIEKSHIVGMSTGGMIGQELAIHWPHRVLTLTSVMSMTGDPDLPGPTEDAIDILTAPPPASAEAYAAHYARAMALLRPYGFFRDERRDAGRVARHVARGLWPGGVERQLAAVAASGGRKSGLAGLKVPALVVHGTDDPMIPLAAGEATAEAIPGARLVVLEHVGHGLPIETWMHVVDAIDQTAKAP